MADTNEQKIDELLSRGVVEVIQKEVLKKKLLSGKELRIKLGIDPSGADLHIGHMVVIKKLKEFQNLGHKIILLFGNFTGQIGDPTGKMETRQAKSKEDLNKNAEKYINQVKFFLDTDKVEVRWNADWLEKLGFADVVKLASSFTVAQMMERDMFQDRVKNNLPISMHEFMYPLMTGYDSVALKADLEIGGTDQTFNLLCSRPIQKSYGQVPQDCLTVPLLEGTDGVKKMGKSEDNYIAVDDEPKDMFGKIMSVPDNLITKYFELATDLPIEEIKEIEKKIKAGENPMEFKKKLGREIIKIYHDEKAAQGAEEEFKRVFSKHQLPEEIEEKTVPHAKMNLIELLAHTEMVSSKGEARRLIQQGAVKVNKEKITDIETEIDLTEQILLQAGKRKFLRVKREN